MADRRILAILVILFLVELAAVFSITMPESHFPGIIALPFAIVNVAVVLGIIRIAEELFKSGGD